MPTLSKTITASSGASPRVLGLNNEQQVQRVDARSSTRATDDERNAILASVYEERRELLRAQRAGTLSTNQREYLVELDQYIDNWEQPEIEAVEADDVWKKLDQLASEVLAVQAQTERLKK